MMNPSLAPGAETFTTVSILYITHCCQCLDVVMHSQGGVDVLTYVSVWCRQVCVWPDGVMMGEQCEAQLICPDQITWELLKWTDVSYFWYICYITGWFDGKGSAAISVTVLTFSTIAIDKNVVTGAIHT